MKKATIKGGRYTYHIFININKSKNILCVSHHLLRTTFNNSKHRFFSFLRWVGNGITTGAFFISMEELKYILKKEGDVYEFKSLVTIKWEFR